MIDKEYLENMAKDIQKLRRLAEHLKETGKGIESIDRNLTRILSSSRLLELNVTDVAKIVQ
jgi:hypothetical protein